MKLSQYERETIINFNAEESTVTLYTRDPAIIRKLDQLVISFPEVYKCIGETDIDKTYEMPKSAVNYRKPRRLSAEQREAARERLKAAKYATKTVDIVPTIEYNNTLEVIMNYLTAAEAADKWGISSRRVTKLCNEGRVKGAVRKSNVWLIPTKAEKPQELKRGVKPKS